jgi:outer membrane protein OmpA-like peptidoglycan-associated protein
MRTLGVRVRAVPNLRRAPSLVVLCVVGATAGMARAEGVNTSAYRAAAPGQAYFTAEDAATAPRGQWHVGATLDAGTRLLVVRDPETQMTAPGGEIVGERLALHLAGGWGVHERLELGLAVATALQRGDASRVRPALRAAALGDVRLRAKLRAWQRGTLALSAVLEVVLPTSSSDSQFGEPGAALAPAVVASGAVGRATLAAQLGYRLRSASRVGDLVVDDELTAAIAARYPVARRLWAQAEVTSAIGTRGKGNEPERPVESLAGVRALLGGPWVAMAGVGAGLSRGYGTPGVRAVLMLGYVPKPAAPRRRAVAWTPPETPDERGELPPARSGEPEVIQVVGDRIVLPARVLFPLDGDELLLEGLAALGAVAKLWREHPEWEAMRVEGHTDVRGGTEANQRLSERRARRVRDKLIELGFEPTRIEAVGLGESRPAVAGTDEAAHARNRRVELVITKRRVPAPASAAAAP